MNDFANSLLSVMLSWLRGLFSGLLSFLQGSDGGMIAWLGSHWMILAVVLIAAGIVIDALVYVLRWRPQYVWRTRFRRTFRPDWSSEEERQFSEGFDQAMPGYDFGDMPISDLSMQQEGQNILAAEQYYAEPVPQPEPASPVDDPPEEEPADPPFNGRNRRSNRHSRRKKLLPGLGRRRSREPAVDYREHFHSPVYPSDIVQHSPMNREDDPNV